MSFGLRAAAAALTVLSAILIFDIATDIQSRVFYFPDQTLKGGEFWAGRASYTADEENRLVPYQLPGPLDVWAGGEKKSIVIPAPFAKPAILIIRFFDSHGERPPVLEITAGDSFTSQIQVSKGSGEAPHNWVTRGGKSSIEIAIPEQPPGGDGAGIAISSVAGSWAVIESMELNQVIPIWRWAASFAAAAWIVLLIAGVACKCGVSFARWMASLLRRPAFAVFALVFAVFVYEAGSLAKWIVTGAAGHEMLLGGDGYLLFRAVSRTVLEKLPEGYSHEEALNAMRDYVYLAAHPVPGEHAPYGPALMLLHGGPWCDQSSWIYIYLIAPLGAEGYVAYLEDEKGQSPHTVAYVAPAKHSGEKRTASFLQQNARVVDCYFGEAFRRKSGGYAAPADICAGAAENIRSPAEHNEFYCREPVIYASNKKMMNNSLGESWFYSLVLPRIPTGWIYSYIKIVLRFGPFTKESRRQYILARVDHLFFQTEKAREGYFEVERRFPGSRWARYAGYYRRRLPYFEACFTENGYTGVVPDQLIWGENSPYTP